MSATFPGGVWDGGSGTRDNFAYKRQPDGIDYARSSEEIIAVQKWLLAGGAQELTTVNVTGATTLPNGALLVLVDASGGPFNLQLPDPSLQFPVIHLTRIDATLNVVTVVPFGSETINGESSKTLIGQWSAPALATDGGDWFVV